MFDPIVSLIVVAGVFICYALMGSGAARKKKMKDEEFVRWFAEQEAKRSKDYVRYQNWLYDHRQ